MERIIDEIHDGDQVEYVDMTDTRSFVERVAADPLKVKLIDEIDFLKGLNSYQSVSVISELLCIVQGLHRKYLHSYTDEHIARVREIRAIKKQAKESGTMLWPEIPEK